MRSSSLLLAALCCLALAAACQGRVLLDSTTDEPAPLTVLAQPMLQEEDLHQAVHEAMQARLLQAVPTFWDKVSRVVQDFCYLNSQAGCDVDYKGETSWWKQYFSSLTPMSANAGHSELLLQNNTQVYKSSYRNFVCAYNPVAPQTCRLDGQSISSNTVTQTHTQSYSFQGKVGVVSKFKAFGSEVSVEVTFDFGYSFSDSTADSKLEGETTVASVQIPMTPQDKRCAVISVILQRVKQTGSMNMYVSANGWVGTHQQPNRHWQYVDSSPSETHYFRAFSFPWLIQTAKQHNQASAKEWQIASDGTARLNTPFTFDFDVAVSGYADPQMYPIDDARCKQS